MADETPAGRIVRPAKNGGTKVIRASSKRWSEAAEGRFLATLAETCNVKLAAAAARFSTVAIYNRRAKWPAFAAAWDEAIATGYARLEARLVELATDSLRAPDLDDECSRGEPGDTAKGVGAVKGVGDGLRMTVAEALNLLRLHRASVKGGAPQRYGWRRNAPDADAVRASILRKIAAIKRARALPAQAGGGKTDGAA